MRHNFHWQIIVLIAAGMILLAVIGSLTAAFIINKRVSDLVHDQAAQITSHFAHQSILPLLSGVGENAIVDFEATLSYSNVKALGIYKKNGELLIGSDFAEQQDLSNLFPVKGTPFKPKLVKETQTFWIFVAPVYNTDIVADDEQAVLDTLFTQSPILLGYVSVTIDTSKLLKIQRELLKDNFFISIAIAGVLLLFAVLITRRMVSPLYKFISLMKLAEEGDDSVRARLSGPVEIKNMTRAFNTMMQALEQRREYAEQQHDSLLTEIDERVKIEKALRESEANLKSLLAQHEAVVATVPGIIVEVDKEGRLKWWNKRLEQVTGLTKEQIEQRKATDFMPNENASEVVHSMNNTFLKGKAELHTQFITQDGTIPYQFNGVRIDHPSGDISLATILAIGIDDSESVDAQQALKEARDMAIEAARLKSEFLANMSHEIRTPMNGMLGMLQLLANGDLNTEQKGFSEIALRSADHLMDIINDVLDFSKIEAGKLGLHKTKFVLRGLIEDVVELFSTKAYEKGLGIYADVLFDTPSTIITDPQRLKQIVSNLVSNAIKFTDQGYVLVKVSINDGGGIKSALTISVTDTGIGIKDNLRDKVFESFAQVDGSSTRKYSGTGLGLAIVKQLSNMLGGTIELESEFNKGSTFSVSFPLEYLQPGYDIGSITYDFPKDLQINYMDGDRSQSSIFKKYTDFLGLGYHLISREDFSGFYPANVEQVFFVDANFFDELTALEIWSKITKFKIYVLVNHINSKIINSLVDKFNNAYKQQIPIRFKSFVDILSQKNSNIVKIENSQAQIKMDESISKGQRILVVEDNEVNQRVVVTMLKKLGYDALLATDGEQAIDMLKNNNSIELVFMDCQMPVMDGYVATRMIRNSEKDDQYIKIVAMTGNALEGDRQKCLNAGMDDHVAKPIRLSTLKESLQKWLSDE